MFYDNISDFKYDFICGVPYSALTFASGIAYAHNLPMLLKRKSVKEYGTKKIIEGIYSKNQEVLIIEDVVTSGASVLETTGSIEDVGLNVKNICVLIDRNQGGVDTLTQMGYNVRCITNIYTIINVLHNNHKISDLDKTLALNSLTKITL